MHTDNAGMNLTVEYHIQPSTANFGAMQPCALKHVPGGAKLCAKWAVQVRGRSPPTQTHFPVQAPIRQHCRHNSKCKPGKLNLSTLQG